MPICFFYPFSAQREIKGVIQMKNLLEFLKACNLLIDAIVRLIWAIRSKKDSSEKDNSERKK